MRMVEQAEPAAVTGELKAHLRLEDALEDALLAGWLRTATEVVETELGALLLERGVTDEAVVRCGAVPLALGPVRLVDGVDVRDAAGAWQPLAAAAFSLMAPVDGAARVNFAGLAEGAVVRVRYRAGLATARNGLPETVRQAVVRLAAHWYANRDGADAAAMPPALRQMLAPLRRRRLR